MLIEENRGFALITVLVLLSLLTVLSIGLYIVTLSTQQDSVVTVKEEQARYYAETGMLYVKWALANDADLDAIDVPTRTPAATPAMSTAYSGNDPTIGDREEWVALQSNPGPTSIGGTDGAIMYFDNSPLASRAIKSPIVGGVTMRNISASLPRYIRVDIGADGAITTAISPMPHNAVPVKGTDIPLKNGSVVWLTAGNATSDFALDPTLGACAALVPPVNWKACRPAYTTPADTTVTPNIPAVTYPAAYIASYSVVIYSVGYVDGKPLALIRSIVM